MNLAATLTCLSITDTPSGVAVYLAGRHAGSPAGGAERTAELQLILAPGSAEAAAFQLRQQYLVNIAPVAG